MTSVVSAPSTVSLCLCLCLCGCSCVGVFVCGGGWQ